MAKQSISPSTVPVNTIQSLDDVVVGQATSVKVLFDKAASDGKTYINDTLIAELNGNDGSKKIGHNSPNIAADNTADAIEEVYAAIASTSIGELVDNSVPNIKLATDIKVGSLATLTTTEKASVVGAINEIDAYVDGVPEQADTIETNLNILRTAKVTTGSNVALAVDTDGTFDMTRNGNTLTIIPNVANTGAMTIAVDGQTAMAIQKANDAGDMVALEVGDLKKNVPTQLVWDSVNDFFIFAPKGGSNIKSIQRGSVSLTTTSLNVPITHCEYSKSVLKIDVNGNSGVARNMAVFAKLNADGNSFDLSVSTYAIPLTISWSAEEYNNVKSKQYFEMTGTYSGSPEIINNTITSVNTSKTIVIGTHKTTNSNNDIDGVYFINRLSSATNVETSLYGNGFSHTLNAQVLEFN